MTSYDHESVLGHNRKSRADVFTQKLAHSNRLINNYQANAHSIMKNRPKSKGSRLSHSRKTQLTYKSKPYTDLNM